MTTTIDAPVAPALPTTGTGRYETYTRIHKALRLLMAETLASIGRTDAAQEAEVATTLRLVRELTAMCRVHLHTENQFLHTAMEARRPGSANLAARDHADHEVAIERVEADALAVEKSTGEARASLLFTLYNRVAVFVGENLEHMNEEETHNQSVLWETHTDAELQAIEGAIIASHTPAETAASMRWMIPALPPAQGAALVGMLRRVMPEPAFHGLLGLIFTHVGAKDDVRLTRALGV